MSGGEAGNLVVEEARREPGGDQVGVAQRAAAALEANDPDRAIGLDPPFHLVELAQFSRGVGAHEDEVAFRTRLPDDAVDSPVSQVLDESRLIELHDPALRAWLHAECADPR